MVIEVFFCLNEERKASFENYITDPLADHTFIDAGKGAIHGDEREYAQQEVSEGKPGIILCTARSILL